MQEYERSKFLGGDSDHTHLVKGLDYLLLNKIRAQQTPGEPVADLDAEIEELHAHWGQNSPAAQEPAVATTKEGAWVLDALRKQHDALKRVVGRNELFMPGRMYFQVCPGIMDQVTMHVRSQEEVRHRFASGQGLEATEVSVDDGRVIRKVIEAMEAKRRRRDQSRDSTVKEPGEEPGEEPEEEPEEVEPDLPMPAAEVFDSDDDIFAEAGVDYEFEADGPQSRIQQQSRTQLLSHIPLLNHTPIQTTPLLNRILMQTTPLLNRIPMQTIQRLNHTPI
ncbi:hypothetical protein GGF46_003386 [Coemansia sp. RSA 552]|nr:hypothetical protein GGF46_003386 [Coemansia sp. RSA 552]